MDQPDPPTPTEISHAPGTAGWRQWLPAAAAALFVGILSAEAVSRIDDWIFSDVPLHASPSRDRDLTIQETWGIRGRPHGHYRRWALNSHGFLGPEAPAEPVGQRVMVLGASETFGLYESKGNDYPAMLTGELKRNGNAAIEIVNAAVAGMSLPAMTVYWERWASKFKPSAVLVYPSSHFYLADTPPAPPIPRSTLPPPPAAGLASRFAERLQDQFRQIPLLRSIRAHLIVSEALKDKSPEYVFNDVPQDRIAAFTADLERLGSAIEKTGARPVLITHALKQPRQLSPADRSELGYFRLFFPRAKPEVFLSFSAEARQATLDLARRRGWPIIDAAAALSGRRELFADPVHFNNEGSRRMAGVIAEALPTILSRTSAGHRKTGSN